MDDDYLEIRYVDTSYESKDYTSLSCGGKEKSEKSKGKVSKVTDNVLTPYEYARLLSAMAKLLAAGFPPQVEWDGPFDAIAIAKKQIEQRVGTLVVVRRIPDLSKPGGFREEVWDLKSLDIRDS